MRTGRTLAVRRGLVTAAASLAVLVGVASPVQAHEAIGDWADNDQICAVSSCVNTGNLVVAWQSILWARGYLAKSEIDGDFGPKTEAATKKWQAWFNSLPGYSDIAVDGWVGSQTWTRASWLLDGEDACGPGSPSYSWFNGGVHYAYFRLNCTTTWETGKWYVYTSGVYVLMNHGA